MAKPKSQCDQIIASLEDKIQEYETIIEQILKEKENKIGIVICGPVEQDGANYYRVNSGGSDALFKYKKSLLFPEEKIKDNCQVVVTENTILGVVPENLIKKPEIPDFKRVQWSEIGGLKSQVERVRESIELPLKNASIMKDFGLEPIKGILLYGAPGCGKTLIAKAIATVILSHEKTTSEAFTYVKGGEMLSMYVGATEQLIGRLFEQARKYCKKHGHRAIIFIDEADAILPARGSRKSSDVETTIVPTFLAEMDGFDQHSPIVILSTNHPEVLDSGIIREGRIDIRVEIGRPTKEDAKEIFEIHLQKVKTLDKVEDIAYAGTELLYSNGLSHRVTGSMIETIVKIATQRALSRKLKSKDSKAGVIVQDVIESIISLH